MENNDLFGSKEKIGLISLGMVYGIVNFLSENSSEKLFVKRKGEENYYELKLNSLGNLCFLDGKNLRLLDCWVCDFYFDENSLNKFLLYEKKCNEKEGNDDLYRDGVRGFSDAVLRAVDEAMEGDKVDRAPTKSAPPKLNEDSSLFNFKNILSIIESIDSKYMVFAHKFHNKDCYKIKFRKDNVSSVELKELESLGCEVTDKSTYFSVIVFSSKEEERIARSFGFKFSVIY